MACVAADSEDDIYRMLFVRIRLRGLGKGGMRGGRDEAGTEPVRPRRKERKGGRMEQGEGYGKKRETEIFEAQQRGTR